MFHPIFHEEEEHGEHKKHEEYEKEYNQEKATNITTSSKCN